MFIRPRDGPGTAAEPATATARAPLAGAPVFSTTGNDDFALTYFNEGELGFIHPAAKAFTLK